MYYIWLNWQKKIMRKSKRTFKVNTNILSIICYTIYHPLKDTDSFFFILIAFFILNTRSIPIWLLSKSCWSMFFLSSMSLIVFIFLCYCIFSRCVPLTILCAVFYLDSRFFNHLLCFFPLTIHKNKSCIKRTPWTKKNCMIDSFLLLKKN